MKKTIIFLLAILMLLNVGGCADSEELKMLKERYPDAKITASGTGYSIISENVSIADCDKTEQTGVMDKEFYVTYDAIMEQIDPQTALVFLGKKTGESKQHIAVGDEIRTNGIPFTESKVEVIEPYFGDIDIGDEIVLLEYFVITTEEDGSKILGNAESWDVVDDKTYLFFVRTSSKSQLYSGQRYHAFIQPIDPSDTSDYHPIDEERFADTLVKKYYIDKDTAVNKEQLARICIRRNKNQDPNALDSSQTSEKSAIINSNSLINTNEIESADYERLKEGLTDAQVESININIRKYGEK